MREWKQQPSYMMTILTLPFNKKYPGLSALYVPRDRGAKNSQSHLRLFPLSPEKKTECWQTVGRMRMSPSCTGSQ